MPPERQAAQFFTLGRRTKSRSIPRRRTASLSSAPTITRDVPMSNLGKPSRTSWSRT